MQEITLITFSFGKKFKLSEKHITQLAKNSNFFNNIINYSYEDLDKEFLSKYSHVMSFPRSVGHFIWKVHLINKTLNASNKDDIVIYMDVGSTLNPSGSQRFWEYIEIINSSKYGNLMFENPAVYIEKAWTTKRLFDYFDIDTDSEFANTPQLMGGHLLFKNNEHTKNYMKLYMDCLEYDQKLITDYYNSENNHEGFIENRHDQSIWSLLTKSFGGNIIKNECDFRYREEEQIKYPFLATRHTNQDLMFRTIFKLFESKAINTPRYFVPVKAGKLEKKFKKYFYFYGL